MIEFGCRDSDTDFGGYFFTLSLLITSLELSLFNFGPVGLWCNIVSLHAVAAKSLLPASIRSANFFIRVGRFAE
jgi:hypothetical protein